MEKVVYLIFSRTKDSFKIIYAGDCEKTDETSFFMNNSAFQCWTKTAGSEDSLYLAILPMFESSESRRKGIVNKICFRYHPPCNKELETKKPDYVIRSNFDLESKNDPEEKFKKTEEKVLCPCCGSEMKIDKVLENTSILKCVGCGISDTRLNS